MSEEKFQYKVYLIPTSTAYTKVGEMTSKDGTKKYPSFHFYCKDWDLSFTLPGWCVWFMNDKDMNIMVKFTINEWNKPILDKLTTLSKSHKKEIKEIW